MKNASGECIGINGANVIVEFPGDEVLLNRTKDHQNPYGSYWNLPGGGIEQGELSVDAAIRELYEEDFIEVQRNELNLVAILAQRVVRSGKIVWGQLDLYHWRACADTDISDKPYTDEALERLIIPTSEAIKSCLYHNKGLAYARMLAIWHNSIRGRYPVLPHEGWLKDPVPFMGRLI